jgi:hypothetical protein
MMNTMKVLYINIDSKGTMAIVHEGMCPLVNYYLLFMIIIT